MKLVIGFSTLLMVSALAGCYADTTIATAGGSGGGQGPGGTGGTRGGSGGGSGEVDGSVDLNPGTGGIVALDAPRVDETTCCPRDLTMSGCMHLGGSSDQAFGCTLTCEFYCSENWHVVKDQHGCEGWVFSIRKPAPGEDQRCSTDHDAGTGVDATPSFDAPPAVDTSAGVDATPSFDVNGVDAAFDH